MEKVKFFPRFSVVINIQNLEFEVIIHNIEKWVLIKCMVLDTSDLSMPLTFKLFKKALELNYDLPEVTFSSYQGNLYIEMDCLVGVDFDDFAGEFESISDGIEHFIDFVHQQKNVILTSTKGKAQIQIHKRTKKNK